MFDGPAYDRQIDHDRLAKQHDRVRTVMADGMPRTLQNIQRAIWRKYQIADPEASISAQLRHLRKPRFGAHKIQRRRVGGSGLHEYWMVLTEGTLS